jgi:hypothetical protein
MTSPGTIPVAATVIRLAAPAPGTERSTNPVLKLAAPVLERAV